MIQGLFCLLTDTEEISMDSVVDELMNPSAWPAVWNRWCKEFPEKALHLGIRIILATVCFIIGTFLIKLVRKMVKKTMNKAGAEKGVIQFVDSFLKGLMYVLLVFTLAASFGIDAASVVALVGSAGVAIGLAIQGSLSNLAGGVLLLILKPFKVGDYIKETASGTEGTVQEIKLFYTNLITPDNRVVVLPNGTLANHTLTNITAQPTRRIDIPVGISYKADLKEAKRVLLEEVLYKDPAVLTDKDRIVFVDELASSSVNLVVRCWVKQEDYWETKWRITENCKLQLDAAGVEIPYPQMDVHLNSAD